MSAISDHSSFPSSSSTHPPIYLPIATGHSSFSTTAIHRSVFMCYGCRIPFNLKRKGHNCYNCGLALCHSCSSKKCLKASMAPNPNKPYRVCDNCFAKLLKATETSSSSGSAISRRASMNQGFNEQIENNLKEMESGSSKRNKKMDFSSNRVVPIANGVSERRAPNGTKSLNPVLGSSKKFFSALLGLTLPKVGDDAKRKNVSLSEEVLKLKAQVEDLTRKAQLREIEMEKTAQQLKEALKVAGEETVKCKVVAEWIEHVEPGVYITLVSLPGGFKDLKRVRFSRKRFSEKQAEQWWAANKGRVYQQYNVQVVKKSSIPTGREGLAH